MSNIISSYDSLYYKRDEHIDSGIKGLMAQEGGLTVSYENGYVSVRSERPTTAQLTLYTAAGQQNRVVDMNLQMGETTLFVGDMPTGVYVANVSAPNGQTGMCKFVIK